MKSIRKEVEIAKQPKALGLGLVLEMGGMVAAFTGAIPVGIGLMVAGEVTKAAEHALDLRKERMPDEWLEAVAQEQGLSKKGLKYITKKADKQGYVTVAQAITFIDIEDKEVKAKEVAPKSKGTHALNDRLREVEGPSLLEQVEETIQVKTPKFFMDVQETIMNPVNYTQELAQTGWKKGNVAINATSNKVTETAESIGSFGKGVLESASKIGTSLNPFGSTEGKT
ncbi:hypothetical protein [Neptuniibacter sp. QD37_11]|uniref:hypothetical protein n=1 Tax=Neptuniibacter sp. QD37_11 TaxID=3398209 RepID=UPI0039F463B3